MAGPTLSLCCLTAGPGPRVAATLGLFRPVVDELVVAVDDRADPEVDASLAGLADEVIRYGYREPVDRPLRWLFSRCRGDWILNVDDDEVPSARLLASLPDLVRARDVTHYWLQRLWLWPDRAHAIAEHPWTTDYQLRLVLNDERLLNFPTETHRPIEAIGPHRYLRRQLYHGDLVLNAFERRLAKAQKYERLRPGKRIDGLPLNHVFHLPERRPWVSKEPLPPADAALVEQAFAGAAAPAAGPRAPRVDDAEIDALWGGRAVDRHARLELLDLPDRLLTSERRTCAVRVTNVGETTWPSGVEPEPEIKLGYRWLDERGNLLGYGPRTILPVDMPPGAREVIPLHVHAPDTPGRYRIEIDLVHERGAWFGCTLPYPVFVAQQPRVALEGPTEGVVERLADEEPKLEPAFVDFRPYLLEGMRRRPGDLPRLMARTLALLAAARGLPLRLPRGGEESLRELARCTNLRLIAGPRESGTLELWLQATTAAAARRLGLTVSVEDGALAAARDPLDRLLARSISRETRTPAPPPVATEEPAAPPEWEFVPEGWSRAVGGWDVAAVADAYRRKWPSFLVAVEGAGPLGVNHEVPLGHAVPRDDRDAEHLVLAFGYVLALAARGRERMSVLDWGGGPGHYAVLARALLPGVELDYHVRDLPQLTALGRELQPDVTFHDDEPSGRFDLVVASSSLHYAEDWRATLGRLAAASNGYVYVTRVPVALRTRSFVVLQRAHAYGYDTEYLGWVLNGADLVGAARAYGLELVREFVLPGRFAAAGAPESPVEHRGYLFSARSSRDP